MEITKQLYEQDFYLWLEKTAEYLRVKDTDNLDWDNLILEIESMGKDKKRELKSRLTLILTHLLKWCYQPQQRPWYGNSWVSNIIEQRTQLNFLLEDSPSLKPYYQEMFDKCYALARKNAAKETGLSVDIFPQESPFDPETVINPDYLPE